MNEQNHNSRERVPYHTRVSVIDKNHHFETEDRNLSLSGAFLKTDEKIPLYSKCHIIIDLAASNGQVKLHIESKVVRIEDDGFGVVFEGMEPETFAHLKNLVLYNSPDPQHFLDDCKEHPGFK